MECIICLNDVSYNDYIILDCCKKIVHISCINNWIQSNINSNTEIDKCFYCKKENECITNIIHNISISNETINDNDNDNDSDHSNNTYIITIPVLRDECSVIGSIINICVFVFGSIIMFTIGISIFRGSGF